MGKSAVWAYKIDRERHIIFEFPVWIPQLLMIDPAGHFTSVRCAAIMTLDRFAYKIGWLSSHRIANLCEFLANYPIN